MRPAQEDDGNYIRTVIAAIWRYFSINSSSAYGGYRGEMTACDRQSMPVITAI